jgi:hypothetical protein
MSDFFSSLVARSIGTVPVIRPRLTSLFEPIRGESSSIGDAFASVPDETPLHLETERDVESPRKQDRKRAASLSVPADDEQRKANMAEQPPASPALTPSDRHMGEPERIVARRVMDDEAAKPEPQRPSGREASDRILAVPAVEQQETTSVRPPSVVPEIVPPVRHQATADDERGLLIPPKLTPEMRLSDLALSARQDRPHQEERSFLAEASQPSEATVQVTIGRIEVRATKEGLPSPRSRSKSPVMSLDEYLRGRTRRVGP